MADGNTDIRELAASIVGSYVEQNRISSAELPSLIRSVYTALAAASGPVTGAPEPAAVGKATPAQIRRSITPDALMSFIDGKPYRALKRHINSHGLTVPEYLARYGLPANYPLVCERTSTARSLHAKRMGLGRTGADETAPVHEAPSAPEVIAGVADQLAQMAPEQDLPRTFFVEQGSSA